MAVTFAEFLDESENLTIDDIEDRLKKLGHTNFKRSSSRSTAVLTDDNRVKVLERIEKEFSDLNAKYDPDRGSSSIGAVGIGIFTVGAKPASKQGKKSAGLDNEDAMLNGIRQFTNGGPMTVRITDGRKKYEYKDVVDIEEIGRDTSNRKKADVRLVLENGKKIPISIKKDNAEMWESADSYWAAEAKKIVDKMVMEGQVKLTKVGSIYRMSPNLGVYATDEEKKNVVFGSDLLNKGFVVVRTFRNADFKLDDTGDVLEVHVTKIIDSMNDLKGENDIFFLIRNDSSRKGSKIYPGLRTLAVNATRINRNVKKVSR